MKFPQFGREFYDSIFKKRFLSPSKKFNKILLRNYSNTLSIVRNHILSELESRLANNQQYS